MKTQKQVLRSPTKKSKVPFDKYDLYFRSVQSVESDVEFFSFVYKQLRKKDASLLREDFCGTFALSLEWIKLRKKNRAIGVDLDPEPLEYGCVNYLPKLTPEQNGRLELFRDNVLTVKTPPADLLVATNFSYYIFKSRELMKNYFAQAYRSLKSDGVFIVDCFGGTNCTDEIEESTKHKGFTYYWDQTNFDPVTNHALYHIHFKVNGQKKQERVFTYDWRMWSIPELREIMREAGFKKTHIYWEGTNRKGTGNGVFTRTEEGEACLSWIAYIAAEK